jgi:hypothetical protein
MLYEGVPEADRVVCPRVRCSPLGVGQVLVICVFLLEREETKA